MRSLHLAPDGVYMTAQSPGRRCALAAPFHPYRNCLRRYISVALALESPPPAVSWHPCPVVPGLSSYLAARGHSAAFVTMAIISLFSVAVNPEKHQKLDSSGLRPPLKCFCSFDISFCRLARSFLPSRVLRLASFSNARYSSRRAWVRQPSRIACRTAQPGSWVWVQS